MRAKGPGSCTFCPRSGPAQAGHTLLTECVFTGQRLDARQSPARNQHGTWPEQSEGGIGSSFGPNLRALDNCVRSNGIIRTAQGGRLVDERGGDKTCAKAKPRKNAVPAKQIRDKLNALRKRFEKRSRRRRRAPLSTGSPRPGPAAPSGARAGGANERHGR